MNRETIATELMKIAKEVIGASASLGSHFTLIRDVKTKSGVEFVLGEEVRLVEYTREYPYRVKLEGEGGKGLVLPVEMAWKVLKGFPKPPSMGTLQRWSMDGVASAVDGARVEPDGVSPSGAPSWVLVVGMI